MTVSTLLRALHVSVALCDKFFSFLEVSSP
jgi:hypothetical protein